MEGLRRYLESSQLADVEVEADGRLFPAHRIVLARHSLLLRQLFQNLHGSPHFALPHRLIVRSEEGEHTAEGTKGRDDVMESANFVLPPGAWPLVASFMYQGSVLLHPNNVLPLFDSAARLQIPGLHAQCKVFLMTGMSERDILGLAASAGRSGLAAAEEHCFARIAHDLPTLVRADVEGFARLGPAQLVKLYRRSDLNTEGNEYLLWHILARWTQANLPLSLALGDHRKVDAGPEQVVTSEDEDEDEGEVSEVHEFLREALGLIRFALFTTPQLVEVQKSALAVRLLPEGYFLRVYAHKLDLQQLPTATPSTATGSAEFMPRTPPPTGQHDSNSKTVVIGQVITGAMDHSFLWRIHQVRETFGLDDLLSTATRTFRSPSFVLDGSKRQFVLSYNAMERGLRLYVARSRAVSDGIHDGAQLPELVEDSDFPSGRRATTHYVAVVHPQSSHDSITQEVTPQSGALRVALVDLTSQGFLGRASEDSSSDILLVRLLSVSLPSRSAPASHLTDAINEEGEDVAFGTNQRAGDQLLAQMEENGQGESMIDFMHFFDSGKLADVTLRLVDENEGQNEGNRESEGKAQGRVVKEVKAHRLLLCCGSDYFDSMFGSPWSEALTNEVCIPLASRDDDSDPTGVQLLEKGEVAMFTEMIASFYGKTITPDDSNVLPLLKVSLRFLAHALSESCLTWLKEAADVEQLFSLLLRANRLNLPQAQACLMNRLASEFGGMVHRGQMHLFEQLPYDQVVELTQRDQLCTLSEYQVWLVVSHYINTHGHELHESEVAYLLRMVRYPLLTSVEILQVAQNELVSKDHIQAALAFRLAHYEPLPSSDVAYGQGATRPRSRDGLWCFTIPGIERLLDAEKRRKIQRKEHKRLEEKARNPALINVYYSTPTSSSNTGSTNSPGSRQSKAKRSAGAANSVQSSEAFVDREGCSWTLHLVPEFRQGQQFLSLEIEFFPPASAAHHMPSRHRTGAQPSGRIEEAQLSASTLAARFGMVFTGRVVLQFITQSPFQQIKREFPFAFRYPNERVDYTQLFTLSDLRSLRLVDDAYTGRDALTIQFEVRLDPRGFQPSLERLVTARLRHQPPRRNDDGAGSQYQHEAAVEEAEFLCEVVDKTQLPAVLTSYGGLPDGRGLLMVVGGRERRDARVDSLQIRGAKAEVDVLVVNSRKQVVAMEHRLVFATISANHACYVLVVNTRDRVTLLPHLAPGDTADVGC